MQISIVKFGKPSLPGVTDLVDMYSKRLRSQNVMSQIIRSADGMRKRPTGRGRELLDPVPGEFRVVLDETGTEWTSVQFAAQLQKWIDTPTIKSLAFFIGGPYGFPDSFAQTSNVTWCLGKPTLPSDLAWAMAWEQIYRATTIMNGLPYHHG